MATKTSELTPVQLHQGLYIKRDDLFRPFPDSYINGGKLRQCYMLIDSIKDKYDGVISCSSIYSPQAPITSVVAKHFGLKCVICYGGTNSTLLKQKDMPKLVLKNNAEIRIVSKSGIHKILYEKAKKIAERENLFVVEYGFNIIDYADIMFGAISYQVQNIPDELDNLVITCGSGITTSGVLIGLKKYGKKVKNIHLVCTAPSRAKLIDSILKDYNINANIVYHDLFHRPNFKYESGVKAMFDGIELHPNYEAKTFLWLKNESNIDWEKEKTLLWIVGAYPKLR